MAPSLKVTRDQIGFALSLLVVAAMAFVAALGFRSVLNGWGFALAGGLAAGGATVIVAVAARFRLVIGESVAASAGGFVLLGAVAVGGLPLPGAFGDFLRGITSGWADILSSSPPADITPQFRALPFVIAWIAAAFGGELVRHTRKFGLPAIGPLAMWALSLLFTTENRGLAIFQGVVMLTGTLLLVTVATHLRQPARDGDATPMPTRVRRLASVMAVAAFSGTVLVAPVLGPRLPLADANERFDLRRYQEPPFDPLSVPSPLTQVKAQLKDDVKDEVMFTVTSDTEIDRFPVATLTDYNGVVWTVANEEEDPAAEFVPVDTVLPELEERPPPDDASTVSMTVEVADLSGVWLPTAGVPTNLRYEGERTEEDADAEDEEFEREGDLETRMNRSTGTLALPSGVGSGLTYEVESVRPSTQDDSELASAAATSLGDADDFDLMPPAVHNLAGDITEGITSPWAQVAAMRDRFAEGFYDSSDQQPPGHSWQHLGTMFEDDQRLIGYEEQYAAAAGTMGRRADLPVRVVVGYHIQDHDGTGQEPSDRWEDGTLEVTGNDISAWVEVRLDGNGWVPIDVTPDRNREPQEQEVGQTVIDVVVPDPPPPPPDPPEVQQPQQDSEDQEEVVVDLDAATNVGRRLQTWAVVASVGFGGPLLTLLLIAGAIVGWKVARSRRRRQVPAVSRRIGGAWAETVERCYDAGVVPPRRATPNEMITAWAVDEGARLATMEGDLRHLADSVDRSVYAPTAASEEHAQAAWSSSDRVVSELRSGRSLWRRVWMRVNPRSLFLREDGRRG